ncbi:MAG: hypothetical protein AB7N24_22440 [Dehalococcoidia bacterium]
MSNGESDERPGSLDDRVVEILASGVTSEALRKEIREWIMILTGGGLAALAIGFYTVATHLNGVATTSAQIAAEAAARGVVEKSEELDQALARYQESGRALSRENGKLEERQGAVSKLLEQLETLTHEASNLKKKLDDDVVSARQLGADLTALLASDTGEWTKKAEIINGTITALEGPGAGAITVRLQDIVTALQEDLKNRVEAPVGTILPYYGSRNSLPSDGAWLVCDGETPTTDALRQHLEGLKAPDPHFTPNPHFTPDLRGMFLRGMDWGKTWKPGEDVVRGDVVQGRKAGDYQKDALGPHTFLFRARKAGDTVNSFADAKGLSHWAWTTYFFTPQENPLYAEARAFLGDKGVRFDEETRPKNVAVLWIIKAK